MPEKRVAAVLADPLAVGAPRGRRQLERERRVAGARRRARGGGGVVDGPGRGEGLVLTGDDMRLLELLPRYGVLTWRQIQRSVYGTQYRTAMRISKLVEAGFVRKSQHEGWTGRVLWASQSGVTLVRDRLRVPLSAPAGPPQEQLLHRLLVNDLGLEYEARGATTLTEREVRAAEQSPRVDPGQVVAGLGVPVRSVPSAVDEARSHYLCTAVTVTGGRAHFPDLVVATKDGLRAIEVELVVKEWSRISQILRSYQKASPFAQVFYFATPDVLKAFMGWWEEVDGRSRWHNGWLQRLQMMPANVPIGLPSTMPDLQEAWEQCPIRLFPLNPMTEDVRYRLDMRMVSATDWMDKKTWLQIQAIWQDHASSLLPSGDRVPFYLWVRHQWPQVRAEREKRFSEEGGIR